MQNNLSPSGGKTILLIVLSVAAVISLAYGILTPSKAIRRIAKEIRLGRVEPAKRTLPERLVLVKRHTTRTGYESWGRSPFIKMDIGLTLEGILWDPKNPRAIIAGSVVGIGDKVGLNTVVKIKEDAVTLNDGIGDFEVRLGGEE